MESKFKTPEETYGLLVKLFPSFAKELTEEDHNNLNFHSLFRDFICFYGIHADSFSDKQLKGLAEFINEAVQQQDKLENAISTCFLEHLYQVNAVKRIKPMLSKHARQRLYA